MTALMAGEYFDLFIDSHRFLIEICLKLQQVIKN